MGQKTSFCGLFIIGVIGRFVVPIAKKWLKTRPKAQLKMSR